MILSMSIYFGPPAPLHNMNRGFHDGRSDSELRRLIRTALQKPCSTLHFVHDSLILLQSNAISQKNSLCLTVCHWSLCFSSLHQLHMMLPTQQMWVSKVPGCKFAYGAGRQGDSTMKCITFCHPVHAATGHGRCHSGRGIVLVCTPAYCISSSHLTAFTEQHSVTLAHCECRVSICCGHQHTAFHAVTRNSIHSATLTHCGCRASWAQSHGMHWSSSPSTCSYWACQMPKPAS